MSFFQRIISSLVAAASVLALGAPFVASAAATPQYAASLVAVSAVNLALAPGESRAVSVTFKNTGSATWKTAGKGYVSLYTWEPKMHASKIMGGDWRSSSQTGAIATLVPGGQKGTLTFTVKAPKTAGIYNENFQLAAEDIAWIAGGRFSLSVTVSGTGSVAAAPSVAAPSPASATQSPAVLVSFQNGTSPFQAAVLLLNTRELVLRGGERGFLSILYKNTGTNTWRLRKVVNDGGVRIATNGDAAPSFVDESWPSATVASAVLDGAEAGKTAKVTFNLRAPAKKGQYVARFRLQVDDVDVPGSEFSMPVTVTDDAPAAPIMQPGPGPSPTPVAPPVVSQPSTTPLPPGSLPEPLLRVGIDTIEVESVILTSTSDLSVQDAVGNTLGTISSGVAASVKVGAGGAFQVFGGSQAITASGIVRFVPSAKDAAVTQVIAGGGAAWDTWANGARFRGTLEIRYYAPATVTWLINELPIERYLAGIAEMSNAAPIEYQKALIVAARTYAYWHLIHPGKHVTFTVDSTFDQVYRAFNREVQQPKTVAAVESTRGQVVTYGGQVVITPYYANSDGRTRSWEEVWGGGPKAWLKSVPTPYDIGKKLWGHGVGMSATNAIGQAVAGILWPEIVKYYYTGIDLVRMW